jgi:hypothetical protein
VNTPNLVPLGAVLSAADDDKQSWLDAMPWSVPEGDNFSKELVNRSGRRLVELLNKHFYAGSTKDWSDWPNDDREEYAYCAAVVDHWRASHGYPLNVLQINLRRSARKIDSSAVIAQRTKRLVSIAIKLDRQPKMKLTQMQDVGGCRAVMKSIAAVRALDKFYADESEMKHELSSRDDYILHPRDSGYRGIHLVYRYHSDRKNSQAWNGLKIELQLRSLYQHAWATAVETVGTFIGQALKSSRGPEEWKRFFALMGSVIAIRERAPLVPGTPSQSKQLISELDEHAYLLNVENLLGVCANTLNTVENSTDEAHYYLLKLDPNAGQLVVTGFKKEDIQKAQDAYADAELAARGKPGMDTVLVSVDSLTALPKAYPNYFADTRIFVELLKQALSGHQRRIFTGALKLGPSDPSSAGQAS